jgi:hypothetical protein
VVMIVILDRWGHARRKKHELALSVQYSAQGSCHEDTLLCLKWKEGSQEDMCIKTRTTTALCHRYKPNQV